MEIVELKPEGNALAVTDDNKKEYIQLVTELKMTKAIEKQIQSVLEVIRGFMVYILSC